MTYPRNRAAGYPERNAHQKKNCDESDYVNLLFHASNLPVTINLGVQRRNSRAARGEGSCVTYQFFSVTVSYACNGYVKKKKRRGIPLEREELGD
jgi:hypothetical protein